VRRFKIQRLRLGLGPIAAEAEVTRSERDLLHPLFVVLRDKRPLLYPSRCRADSEDVTRSIEAVRADLTSALKSLGPDSAVAAKIEMLRKACREYLDAASETRHHTYPAIDLSLALSQLRSSFREVAESVGSKYGLASALELAEDMDPKNSVLQEQLSLRSTNYIRGSSKPSRDDVGALWSQEQLSALEHDIEVATIWIVGRDFWSDIVSPQPFRNVMRYNIHERCITYVYVTLDEPALRRQLALLRDALELKADDMRMRAVLLTPAQWERLPYTAGNFTIYDPLASHQTPLGYFWYPGADGESFGRLGSYVVQRWIAEIENIHPTIGDVASRPPSAESTSRDR
jgi:hypothetical protein